MKKFGWRFVPLSFFLLLALFLLNGLSLKPQELPSVHIGKTLPKFHLPILGSDKIFDSEKFPKQYFLLNVWASWCSACMEEQTFLMQLARSGVPIFGLNYKDKQDHASRWLEDWGNPYQLVLRDERGKVAIDLGVYGAPETFLVDEAGIIQYRYAGILTPKVWEQQIKPLMRSAKG